MGDPTVIVNNAGIARGKRIIELTNREFIGTLNVNVVGAHNMLREFLPSSKSVPPSALRPVNIRMA